MYPAPPPQPGSLPPRWTAGLLIAFAFLIAAGATVWGTFGKIQSYRHTYPPGTTDREYRFELTWWNLEQSGTSTALPQTWFPPYGVLPAIAGGLLVIAAVLALVAFGGRRPALVTAIRVGAATGVGMLAGVVALRLLDALQTLDQVNSETLQEGESTDFSIGLGIYLPGGAAVLGIIALGGTLIRGRADRVEPDTPPMGVPMPYGPQQQYQPYQQGYVQQPISQPFAALQRPISQPQPERQEPTSQPIPAQEPPDKPNTTPPA